MNENWKELEGVAQENSLNGMGQHIPGIILKTNVNILKN